MSDAFIDYKFYLHTTFDNMSDVGGFFYKPVLVSVFIAIMSLLVIRLLTHQISKYKTTFGYGFLAIIPVLLILNLPFGILNNLISIAKIHTQQSKEIKDVLSAHKLNWFSPDNSLEGKAGKNIIMIFMESVEESFLKGKFSKLTPHMNSLSKEMNYYNMKQVEGGDFTIGALYTYMTGWPCFFKNNGNEIFGDAYKVSIPSVTNLLDDLGYEQRYLMGNPSFAGMDKMLDLFDFDVKGENDYDPKYRVETWGLHDYDLFQLAKKEILELKELDKPFTFGMSTISTHHPNGVFDKRMAQKLEPQRSDLELMVMALDHHIGDLVNWLKENNLYDNTSLYIMPDHLLMGNYSEVLNDFNNDRDLFLITNGSIESVSDGGSINQLDIPALMLEGAGVKHNMKFLTDHISGDKQKYVSDNKEMFVQLNEASLQIEKNPKEAAQEHTTSSKKVLNKNQIYLRSVSKSEENTSILSKIYLGQDSITPQRGANLIIYDQNIGVYNTEYYDTYPSEAKVKDLLGRLQTLINEKTYFMLLIHDSAGDTFRKSRPDFIELGFKKLANIQNRQAYLAVSQHGYISEELKRSQAEIDLALHPFQSLRTQTQIIENAEDAQRWIAHAGGIYDGKTYTNSLEALDLSYQKGFRMFELDIIKTSDDVYVAAHDWKHWKKQVSYNGPTPPPRDTFMKYKLNGKYSPLDIDGINDWFSNHPETFLVSDKVNDPKNFIPAFFDPNRLMMELFSFEAAEKAKEMGIKEVLLSDNLLDMLGDDKVKEMNKREYNSMAVSLHTILKRKEEFLRMKEAGIKIYAFHVNQHPFKDESFVARELMDYCYGAYADDWNF